MGPPTLLCHETATHGDGKTHGVLLTAVDSLVPPEVSQLHETGFTKAWSYLGASASLSQLLLVLDAFYFLCSS